MSPSLDSFDLGVFPVSSKSWHEVRIAHDVSGLVRVPLAVARGSAEGPTVLVVAGVHGDEFEGPTAIERFFRGLDPESFIGSFVALPLCNPYAFDAQTRESDGAHDGLNLARQFPGNSEGSPTQRLADTLFRFATDLLGSNDLFVDLHSGGTRYEFLPLVGYHPTNDDGESASRKLASAFGIDRVWQVPSSPSSKHTFNGTVARAGIPTIGTEVTGRGSLIEEDVGLLVRGLENVLGVLGVVSGERDYTEQDGTLSRTVNCGASGLLRTRVEMTDRVREGDVLGEIVSLTGEVQERILTPASGEIWAMRRFTSVRAGDLGFIIGMVEG